ncbi:uncharacterized protein LOC128041027 [Gossypium raimondii]|uniref:uncharacterized protein LOC128041027 n=1 Tax=Gossypium raimondii TaxID=29730 RepID=UPI00227AFDAC|nr:uncharacterized protein LOC128041027 [Gossypium raimondii]
MGSIPSLETNEIVGTPTSKTESLTPTTGDDALSQAMIQALERVIGTHSGLNCSGGHRSCSYASEYDKCVRFEEGLRYDLRILIAPQREQCPKKQARFDRPPRAEAPVVVTEIQLCSDCGKRHPDECWRKLGACFICGSMEYQPLKVVQQPPRGCSIGRGGNSLGKGQRALGRGAGQTETRQPVLVYAVRRHEKSDDANVITGTFFIHSFHYYAVNDIGSNHLYIASVVSVNLGLATKNNAREFSVISPLEHQVSLDCETRIFTLKTDENDEVVMVGEHRDYLSNVISALVADKLVQKGCEAYVAYISDSVPAKLSVGDICTVREFLDVFPEELPEVPPDREVEFEIDMSPGTSPVSIEPYRTALKKMTELKAQL